VHRAVGLQRQRLDRRATSVCWGSIVVRTHG
jgi:hypothetical protein